ncbi:hypothetical protein [Acinetobacter higginsii]|uniref:hypothetical protein n=1 Tax=Acinetobacter higginsii TaxID=70347 RepID=UPI001F4B6B6F|nr:hypothetical protein [Acinetobacter higginsii]MCH7317207.1 hypothetical protein [Acinetobacter higginsii]MCI3880807.1 hypothetical protein [Acinetobacter higginsii]
MKLKWFLISSSSFLLALTPIYYAKNTGDFSDYCLSGFEIEHTTCHLDMAYTVMLTGFWFLLLLPLVAGLYFLFEKVIKEDFPKD